MPPLRNASGYFCSGLSALRQHPGLVAGLYALGLVTSILLLLPLSLAFRQAVTPLVLPLDLRQISLVDWWSMLRAVAPGAGKTVLLTVLLVPLHGLVRSVVLTGAAATLRRGDVDGFWTGVGRYGLRGLGLASLALITTLFVFLAASVVSILFGFLVTSERGVFWTQFVLVPILLITGLAVVDLMHDYARAALVVDDADVGRALSRGVRLPFKTGVASRLYVLWFALALGLWLLPFALDSGLRAASVVSIALLFVLQQGALVLRTATTVGWVASSVRLYSDTHAPERTRIAEVSAPAP